MKARNSSREIESIRIVSTMTRFKRMIAISLERIAVMLLIGTAVIFDAAQRMDPGRVDDYGNVKH